MTAVTDSTGHVLYRGTYSAFGNRTATPLPTGYAYTRLWYASREYSVGSLMFNRARFYDTNTGRFQSQDTYRGEDAAPPSLHRYVYCVNNPVRYTDPSGLVARSAQLLVGMLLGAFVLGSISSILQCFYDHPNIGSDKCFLALLESGNVARSANGCRTTMDTR